LLQGKELRTHYGRQLMAASNTVRSEWINGWNQSRVGLYLCLIRKRFMLPED
jgi:hypothetical protein